MKHWHRPAAIIGVSLIIAPIAYWRISLVEVFLWVKVHAFLWQTLVGSFIGAATPVALFLWKEESDRKQKIKDHLLHIERSLMIAINNLIQIDGALADFLAHGLNGIRTKLRSASAATTYITSQAFVPLTPVFSFDSGFSKVSTGSQYLENLKIDSLAGSELMTTMVEDIQRQFDRTIVLYTQLAVGKVHNPQLHNAHFLADMDSFEGFINREMQGYNIPVYLKKLASFSVALNAMARWGIKKWRKQLPFDPTRSVEDSMTIVSNHFKPEADALINSLRPRFVSKLYLTDEVIAQPRIRVRGATAAL